jgi:hypothetical protein
MGWMIGGSGPSRGCGIFLFATMFRLTLGRTQLPIQWAPGALSLWVKQAGHEADHSPPSRAKVKNAWSYTTTPQYAFMAWCSVKKVNKRGTIQINNIFVLDGRHEVFTTVSIQVKVFWVMMSYSVA